MNHWLGKIIHLLFFLCFCLSCSNKLSINQELGYEEFLCNSESHKVMSEEDFLKTLYGFKKSNPSITPKKENMIIVDGKLNVISVNHLLPIRETSFYFLGGKYIGNSKTIDLYEHIYKINAKRANITKPQLFKEIPIYESSHKTRSYKDLYGNKIETIFLNLNQEFSNFPLTFVNDAFAGGGFGFDLNSYIVIYNKHNKIASKDLKKNNENNAILNSSIGLESKTVEVAGLNVKESIIKQNFKPMNISALYQKIKSINLKKGDFEKKQTYRERVNSVDIGPFAIEVKNDKFFTPIITTYDPESEIFSIKLERGYFNMPLTVVQNKIKNLASATYEVKRSQTSSRSYIGSNAFGVKAHVESTHFESYFLIEHDVDRLKQNKFLIEKSVNPIDAKDLTNKIGILIICELPFENPPKEFIVKSYEYSEAKIDMPFEQIYDQYGIFINIKEIWAFNRKTKKVIGKRDYY